MVDVSLGTGLGDRRQELIEVRLDTEQRQQKVEEQVTSDGPLRPDLSHYGPRKSGRGGDQPRFGSGPSRISTAGRSRARGAVG